MSGVGGMLQLEGEVQMAYTDLARSHVRECLREAFELKELVTDPDGDVPFRHGTAAYYVTLRKDGKRVKAWSWAVRDVKATAPLLRELNEVNGELELARIFWRHKTVVVEGVLPVDDLTPERIRELCVEVGETADRVGQVLATVYGGEVAFSDEEDDTCPECGG